VTASCRQRAAGRDPQHITCAYNLEVRVENAPSRNPAVVAGSPDVVAERLLGFVRLGLPR
jgi:hypothetical protein